MALAELGVAPSTAFRWRHRFLQLTQPVKALVLTGVVEADETDFERCLEVQRPYLGPVVGVYTDWTPLANREGGLFPDDYDAEDPWQFSNVIVR